MSVWNRVPRSALAAFGLAVGTGAVVAVMAVSGSSNDQPVTVQQVVDGSSVATASAAPSSAPEASSAAPASSVESAAGTTPQGAPAPVSPSTAGEQPAPQPAPTLEPAPAPAPAPSVVQPASAPTTSAVPDTQPSSPPCWDHTDPTTGQPVYVSCDDWGNGKG